MTRVLLLAFSTLLFTVTAFSTPSIPSRDRQDYLDNALFSAVHNRQFEDVEYWLNKGANPNYEYSEYPKYHRMPVIVRALQLEAIPVVKLLLQYGASADVGLRWSIDGWYNMPFLIEMTKLFIEKGADASKVSLLRPFQNDTVEITKILIEHGANYDRPTDSQGHYRPYFYAYFTVQSGDYTPDTIRKRNPNATQAYLESLGIDRDLPCYEGKSLNEWSRSCDNCAR